MIRTIVIAMAALLFGGMGGFYVMQARLAPELAAAQQAARVLEEKMRAVEAEKSPLQARADRLEKENADVLAKLDSLYDEMNQLRELANEYHAVQASITDGPPVDADEATPSASTDEDPSEGDQGDRRGRWGPEREAEWAERREEFRAQMEDRVGSFFDEEWAKSADAETQARLAAMEEHTQFLMDSRRRMREAETDEAREAVRAEIAQARDNLDALMQAQRTSMLQDVAKRFDVPASKMEQFVRAMERTVEGPFFRSSPVPMGGFRGGFGEGNEGRRGGN